MANNPTKDFHRFRDALRYALSNYEGKGIKRGRALIHLANNLVRMALSGDDREALQACKELIDRLDGKPQQAITGSDGEPLTIVQRVIVHNSPNIGEDVPIHKDHSTLKTIN